jgi:hypothetical protein
MVVAVIGGILFYSSSPRVGVLSVAVFLLAIVGVAALVQRLSILITFLVVILVLYLINMLPIDGRAKQIVRVIGGLWLLKYLAVF